MLKLADVMTRLAATVAVDTVDLEVARGQTVALISPSGSGKSN